MLRKNITSIHISMAKASHGQTNASIVLPEGQAWEQGEMHILAITQSIVAYKNTASNVSVPACPLFPYWSCRGGQWQSVQGRCKVALRSLGSGDRLLEFESRLCRFPAVWPWASYLTLCLNFVLYKTGTTTIIVSVPQSCGLNSLRM